MYGLTQNFILSSYPYTGLISLPRCKRREVGQKEGKTLLLPPVESVEYHGIECMVRSQIGTHGEHSKQFSKELSINKILI
jgi:hypothetical protein